MRTRRMPLRYWLALSYLTLFTLFSLVIGGLLYSGLSHFLWMNGQIQMDEHIFPLFHDEASVPTEALDEMGPEHHFHHHHPYGPHLPLPPMGPGHGWRGHRDHHGEAPPWSRALEIPDKYADLSKLPLDTLTSPAFNAAVLGPDGRVVAQSRVFAAAPTVVEQSRIDEMRLRFERRTPDSERPFSMRMTWEDERSRQVLMVPLSRNGALAGFLVCRTTWHRSRWLLDHFLYQVLVGVLLALVTTVVFSVVLARRWSRPLEVMALAAHRVAEGDLSTRVRLTSPASELHEVSETFDQMVARLQLIFATQQRFVADASHELKTPLAALEGQLHVIELLEERQPEERRGRAVEAASRELRRMERLVSDLLTLSKAEQVSARMSPFSLEEVLQEAIAAALAANPGRNVTLQLPSLGPPGSTVTVIGDATGLEGALRNLIDNGLRHTSEKDGRVQLKVSQASGYLRLTVEDNGEGIDPEHLPKLGQRFYRVDKGRARTRGGTGLGLSIVRAVAEKHGGRFEIESEPGRGTRATVVLPMSCLTMSPPDSA